MIATLAHIWRHPIKSHGREALASVTLETGKTLPWDRTWAVTHEGTRADGSGWAPCANFSRGSKAPSLMAIDAKLDERSEAVTLSHPDRPTVTLHPERDATHLIDWVRPLMPQDRAQSTGVMRVPGCGLTDSDYPSISIANLASHAAVEAKLGQALSPKRWRANLWLDGLDAWEETQWVGQTLAIGDARFELREQITRCLATTANPETGARDADTLGALKSWNHQEFGLYAVVTSPGEIRLGDTARLL
jgi:uncharacterized protein YcbX